MELKLLGVARGSLEELLEDYEDFLRQRGLARWKKDDPRAVAVRDLAYKPYTTYKSYAPYLNDPEQAANAMITLINQTNFLLDQQMRAVRKSGMAESHTAKVERVMRERRKGEKEFDVMLAKIVEEGRRKSG